MADHVIKLSTDLETVLEIIANENGKTIAEIIEEQFNYYFKRFLLSELKLRELPSVEDINGNDIQKLTLAADMLTAAQTIKDNFIKI